MVIILLLPQYRAIFFVAAFTPLCLRELGSGSSGGSGRVLLPLAHCCCVDMRNSVRPVCCGLVPGSRGRSCGQSGIDFSSLHVFHHCSELLPQNLPRVHVRVFMCV